MYYVWLALAGIAAGVFGGMGMGGGTVLIPLLTLLFAVPQKTAQAVNLISFFPMAAAALLLHVRNKLVRGRHILYIIVPGLAAGLCSSLLAHQTADKILQNIFGGFLVLLGVYQFISVFMRKKT
jgi:uncharacterized membrane protein YfcA